MRNCNANPEVFNHFLPAGMIVHVMEEPLRPEMEDFLHHIVSYQPLVSVVSCFRNTDCL